MCSTGRTLTLGARAATEHSARAAANTAEMHMRTRRMIRSDSDRPQHTWRTDTARWHGKRSSHGHVSLVQYACDRADLATCESLQQLLSRQARRRGYYGRPHAAHIEGRARCDILVVFGRIGRRLGLRFRLDAACEVAASTVRRSGACVTISCTRARRAGRGAGGTGTG